MKSKILFTLLVLVFSVYSCNTDDSMEESLSSSKSKDFFPEQKYNKNKNPIQERSFLVNREMLIRVTNFAGNSVNAIVSINGYGFLTVYSEDRSIAYHYPTDDDSRIMDIDVAKTRSTTYYDKTVDWFHLMKMYEGITNKGIASSTVTGETWTLTVIERY